MCSVIMFGLCDPVSKKRYKKKSRLRTNGKFVHESMACACDGSHDHERLEGQTRLGGR